METKFINGNGIYIFNKKTKEIKYYCYISNLDQEDYQTLKEDEIFITYYNGEVNITQKK